MLYTAAEQVCEMVGWNKARYSSLINPVPSILILPV